MTVPTVPTVPTPRRNGKTTQSLSLAPSVPTVPTYLYIYKEIAVAVGHTQRAANFGGLGRNGWSTTPQTLRIIREKCRSYLPVPTHQKEGTDA